MAAERVRMTLDLSARLNGEVERFCEERGMTKADALRLGVSYLLKAERAREEGFTVGAWKVDGNTRIEREFAGLM
jgi:hypothetical protein